MKEIRFILHAFLLLLAFISFFICLKAFNSIKKPESRTVLTDDIKTTSNEYLKGKQLFFSKCASCHILNKHATGPNLCRFADRGPWTKRENIYQWIRNPMAFMKKDQYTKELKKSFGGAMMPAFPDLSKEDIDEIINYINNACP